MAGKFLAILTFGTLFFGLAAARPAQDEFFVTGNARYQEGDYEGALASYQRVVDAGFESAALYYNIGNTYFKLGELGRSIVFFERAAEIDPGDENIRANLELARSLTADEITPIPTFWVLRVARWWVGLIPLRWLQIVVGTTYLCAVVSLTILALGQQGRVRSVLRNITVVSAVLASVFGVNLFARELDLGRETAAIVMEPEVPVYSAPSADRSLLVFNVHEGTRVRVDQESGEWVEIVLADGNVGWLRAESIETI